MDVTKRRRQVDWCERHRTQRTLRTQRTGRTQFYE